MLCDCCTDPSLPRLIERGEISFAVDRTGHRSRQVDTRRMRETADRSLQPGTSIDFASSGIFVSSPTGTLISDFLLVSAEPAASARRHSALMTACSAVLSSRNFHPRVSSPGHTAPHLQTWLSAGSSPHRLVVRHLHPHLQVLLLQCLPRDQIRSKGSC